MALGWIPHESVDTIFGNQAAQDVCSCRVSKICYDKHVTVEDGFEGKPKVIVWKNSAWTWKKQLLEKQSAKLTAEKQALKQQLDDECIRWKHKRAQLDACHVALAEFHLDRQRLPASLGKN